MAYTPSTLTIDSWSSPITIQDTDIVSGLDNAMNSIVSTDANSLVIHVNTELAKLPNYLSTNMTAMSDQVIADTQAIADAAAVSETNAATSATNSATSATASATSATSSANSATTATTQAGIATTKATEASTSATNAATSATNAGTSETNAASSATASAGSATNAATSETNAATSATNSANSATASASSATASANSATLSSKWAEEVEDTEVTTGKYSALHHAAKAAASAAAAATFDPSSYYTKTNLDGGQLDNRYYTETESDANFLPTTNPSITGAITEEVSVCTLALEPDNGTVQTYTATGNFTFTDGLAAGQFLTLILTNAGFTPTYPTITWWGDAEPTLGTTDKIFFEKIGSTLYGTHVGTIA